MLKEQRRQAYLQAMGIEVYYPRRALPGAAPSPAYELPPQAAVDTAAAPPVSGAPGKPPARAAGPARELLADALRPSRRGRREGEERTAPTRPQQAAPAQPQPDVESEAPRFLLHFLLHYQPVDSRLALLCELPLQARRESLTQSRQLLAAVLRALGVMTLDSPVETFSWPMLPDMPAAQSGADQARQALGGFVAQRRERAGFGNLLVFSAQIDTLLPGADQHSGRDYAHGADCHVTCTHSLHSMLAMPELKREAWEHLQPLRRRLQEPGRA